MKRRTSLQFVSALLAVWLAAVAAGSAQTSATSPLIVTEKDDGNAVLATVGQMLVIQLPSNPTTGYQWVLPWDLGPLVRWQTRCRKATGGAGGTETFKFFAKDTGTVTLTLDYRRPWENDPPLRSFTVTVNITPGSKCD